MRILDENDAYLGEDVEAIDLTKGHLETETIVIVHHEAIPYKPAEREKRIVWQDPDDPGNVLYEHVTVSPVQWPQDAYDETEPIYRYRLYTPEELEEIRKREEEERKAEEEREAVRKAEEDAAAAEVAERENTILKLQSDVKEQDQEMLELYETHDLAMVELYETCLNMQAENDEAITAIYEAMVA